MNVLFVGGGTMGPVTPLIAVLRRMRDRRPDLTFAWAGTPDGPEHEVVSAEGIPFYSVPVAKLPRYVSIEWLRFPFQSFEARRISAKIVREVKPDLVGSVGGFTSVPIIRAASRQHIPCVIHQLDAEPGLSNLVVAKLCTSVTTSFSYDLPPFRGVTTDRIPTPCRFVNREIPEQREARTWFGLDPERPTIFLVGGGTGASALNRAIWDKIGEWIGSFQVIHLTGKGKQGMHDDDRSRGYLVEEFFDEPQMLRAYAAADLVISRAGIGGISEVASLQKPAIFIPIPQSHQELNVKRLPCAVVQQKEDFASRLLDEAKRLMRDDVLRKNLGQAVHKAFPTDDGSALAERWLKFVV